MLFTSMFFIWIFLPVTLLCNYIFQLFGKNRLANIFLLIVSLFFYAWGEPKYVLLMITSIVINWIFGLLISKIERFRSWLLLCIVLINICILGYFKYAGMLVETYNHVTVDSVTVPNIELPIGISFFTFQALSYVIDVYRGKCSAQKSITTVALYISFFPQLIAGPIVQFRDIEKQIDKRKQSIQQIADGIRRFIYGFAKKVLIANVLASVVDVVYSISIVQINWYMSYIVALMYTLQIYYDFSGYSDMAIGLGKMFGFDFKENFLYPYTALSIREFWKRWHISLSSWFQEYVYIPLGGNRHGRRLTYENLIIVFLLTGLWHGASWNFVVWGLFHGTFMIIERIGLEKVLSRNKIVAWIYTFYVVNVGWVLFRIDNIKVALAYVKRMILPWVYTNETVVLQEYFNYHALFISLCAIVGMGFVQRYCKNGLKDKWTLSVSEVVFQSLLLLLSISSLAANTYNPFIYFRF